MALATGRLADAEDLIARALSSGERAQPGVAIPAYRLQRHTLCEFTGRLAEVEGELRDLVAEYPTRPVFRCALANVEARVGHAGAAPAFAELARDGFAILPFDQEWLLGMALLAETCGALGDAESADVLYRLLSPWSALNAGDHPEGIRGSVARYLGILATALGRWDDAERHFEDAVAANDRMGLRPWLAYARHDYARMLAARDRPGDRERARELLEAARAGYREIGMRPPAGEPVQHP
jgi:tetratricopeptide (TPR) repeat protein